MSKYSIKDLEQITGIKAHTIRIWERRYDIIQPKRTQTNIRFYSDEDLKKLLNISMLNASGIKISHLAKLESTDIETKVIDLSQSNKLEDSSIKKLILATINFDENLFENILSNSINNIGIEDTIAEILFPFFKQVGVLWQVGSINPAQEHFISNLVRQKLFVAIDSVSISLPKEAKKVIFFLREGEFHDLSILFYNYIAKNNGIRTLFLGQNLPYNDLEKVVADYRADAIVTSFIAPEKEGQLNDYLNRLERSFTFIEIFVTGLQLQQKDISIPDGLSVFSSSSTFKDLLVNLNE
ncbi:MAG: DNA-binding transcriptional MerR regulator [Ancylomarina sp.]|jgi:DNA-binding transcriptional MerR regulator